MQAVSGELDDGVLEGFGREGDGLLVDVPEVWRVAREDVQRGLGAEAGGGDAEPGVADGVGGLALVRRAEEDGEAATGVDRAAPAVGEFGAG